MPIDVDNSPLTHQQKLDLHFLHGKYEMAGDLDKTMETLVAEPEYRLNGRLIRGQQSIRAWYQDVIMKLFSWDNFDVHNSMPAADGLAHEFGVRLTWRDKEHYIRGVSIVHFVGDKMRGESLYLAAPFEEIVRELVDLDAFFVPE
jgi:hypothetical protein